MKSTRWSICDALALSGRLHFPDQVRQMCLGFGGLAQKQGHAPGGLYQLCSRRLRDLSQLVCSLRFGLIQADFHQLMVAECAVEFGQYPIGHTFISHGHERTQLVSNGAQSLGLAGSDERVGRQGEGSQ